MWPIEEVESLRGHEVQLRNKKIKKGEVLEIEGITAAQVFLDICVSFKLHIRQCINGKSYII